MKIWGWVLMALLFFGTRLPRNQRATSLSCFFLVAGRLGLLPQCDLVRSGNKDHVHAMGHRGQPFTSDDVKPAQSQTQLGHPVGLDKPVGVLNRLEGFCQQVQGGVSTTYLHRTFITAARSRMTQMEGSKYCGFINIR